MGSARSGARLGRWTLNQRLGHGGNGDVWLAVDDHGEEAAIKILRRTHRDRWQRFVAEISFHREYGALEGVLPMLDCDLSASGTRPWYSMPLATPIRDALGADPDPPRVVDAVAAVAGTLARLHAMGIAHRDVKPDNLFDRDGRWLVGDFGLVRYPEKDAVTAHGRRLGPIDYMAPEMRDDADGADPAPADVYALAKTVWVLLAGASLPLPGPHRADDDAYALRLRLAYDRAPELDRLLEKATRHDPAARVTMEQLRDELAACLAPPAERRASPDRRELVERISVLTEPGRKREEAAAAVRTLFNEAERALREAALGPAYHDLAHSLPGFRSTYDASSVAISRILPHVRVMYGEHGWAGHITSQGRELPVSITVATGVRLGVDADTLSLAGLIAVERASREIPDVHVVCEAYESAPLGSAQQAAAIARIATAMAGEVDATLRLVAMLLGVTDDNLDPNHLARKVELDLAALRGVPNDPGNEPRLALSLNAREPVDDLSVEVWNGANSRRLLYAPLPPLSEGRSRHVLPIDSEVEPGQYVLNLRDSSGRSISRKVAHIPSDT